jgi:gluconolactonase
LKEISFNGVFRYANSRRTAAIKDLSLPNGIGFSPDGKILYVNNSGPDMQVMRYDVAEDGSVSSGKALLSFRHSSGSGVPDGLKVDFFGNIWTTGPGGIRIVTPQGKILGQIKLSEAAANLAWGEDGKAIYITAQTSIYRIRTLLAGEMPRYRR